MFLLCGVCWLVYKYIEILFSLYVWNQNDHSFENADLE